MVHQLTDTQMIHMLRHARILQNDNVAKLDKLESVERLLRILHSTVIEACRQELPDRAGGGRED